jgi:transcriptional/translational regulatory protein YebC/TACO1
VGPTAYPGSLSESCPPTSPPFHSELHFPWINRLTILYPVLAELKFHNTFNIRNLGVVTVIGDGGDALLEAALDAGAEDVAPAPEDGAWEVSRIACCLLKFPHATFGNQVICEAPLLGQVRDALKAASFNIDSAILVWRPAQLMPASSDVLENAEQLREALEALEDVQTVVHDAMLQADE